MVKFLNFIFKLFHLPFYVIDCRFCAQLDADVSSALFREEHPISDVSFNDFIRSNLHENNC